jgi:membrane-associated PAP2 superfamily phosphatase
VRKTLEKSYRRFAALNVVVLLLSGLLFTWIARSGTIDFWLAQQFFDPVTHAFPLKNTPRLVLFGHTMLKNATGIGLIVCIVLALISSWVPFLRPWRRALTVFCVMAASSALIVQSIKNVSVHACPWDLAMYGGDAQWFPLFGWVNAGVELGRCWPGGHASGGFAILAGYFALREQHPQWARRILILALVLGTIMGGVQMVRGAHFLSHNLWTLWIVWATCFVIDVAIHLVAAYRRKPLVADAAGAYESDAVKG